MILKQVSVGSMDNFSYLIGDELSKEAAVIDPGSDAERIIDEAKRAGLQIKAILVTHTHYDHIGALSELAAKTNATVYVHKSDVSSIDADNVVSIDEGSIIKIGSVEVKAIHTPGHTPGGIVYQIGKKLFTGDTLFVEGCGRTDVGGDTETMWDTIQRLRDLKDDYEIYPGHDYGSKPHSTIAHEKKHNRFFLCKTREEFFKERSG